MSIPLSCKGFDTGVSSASDKMRRLLWPIVFAVAIMAAVVDAQHGPRDERVALMPNPSPADLRTMPLDELESLADLLRNDNVDLVYETVASDGSDCLAPVHVHHRSNLLQRVERELAASDELSEDDSSEDEGERERSAGEADVVEEQFQRMSQLMTLHTDSIADVVVNENTERALDEVAQYAVGRDARAHVEDHIRTPERVCAVCNLECNKNEFKPEPVPWADFPGKHILEAGQCPTEEVPRSEQTTCIIDGVEYCLQRDAINGLENGVGSGDDVVVHVCIDCFVDLRCGNVPNASLLRIDPGSVPAGLPPLSFLGTYVLTPWRPHRILVLCKSEQKKVKQRTDVNGENLNEAGWIPVEMKGHVVAYPNSASRDVKELTFPLHPSLLSDYVQVVIIAPVKDKKDAAKYVARAAYLQLNGPELVLWARQIVNIFGSRPFSDQQVRIRLDESALAYYSAVRGVPDELVSSAICAKSQEEADELMKVYKANTSGYAGVRERSEEDEVDMEEAEAVLERHGFMSGIESADVQLSTDSEGLIAQFIADKFTVARGNAEKLNGGGVLALATAKPRQSMAVGNDYDPQWFLYVHVTMFPNGTGACPKNMSIEKWVQYVLRMHKREQFQQNTLFILDAMDILQRHQVNAQSFVYCQPRQQLLQRLSNVTARQIDEACEYLCNAADPKKARFQREQLSVEAKEIVTAVRRSGGHVFGSREALRKEKGQLEAAWILHGHPTTFITLNMSDLKSSLCIRACGAEVTYDDDGYPLNGMLDSERWQLVVSNPAACADFAQRFLEAFAAEILGFPVGATAQIEGKGLCGTILNWLAKMEANGRKALHWHLMITQRELQARVLLKALQPENGVRDFIFNFMKTIQVQMLPEPFYRCLPCTQGSAANSNSCSEHSEEERELAGPFLQRKDAIMGRKIPVPATDDEIRAQLPQLRRAESEAASITQNHQHTFTCTKDKSGVGTDENCRLVLPRCEHCGNGIEGDLEKVLFPRKDPYMVPYHKATMVCDTCNMCFYLCCDESRNQALNKRLEAKGKPPLPKLPFEARAYMQASYSTNYTLKQDAPQVHKRVTKKIALLREKEYDGNGKRLMSRLLNIMNSTVSCPVTLAVWYLQNRKSVVKSFSTIPLDGQLFAEYVYNQKASGRTIDREVRVEVTATANGGVVPTVTGLVDFLHRGTSLEALSVYEITVLFYKYEPERFRSPKHVRLFPTHPEYDTHCHYPSKHLKVPQFFCSLPERPSEDASEAEKDKYASFVLGNFSAYRPSDLHSGGWLKATKEKTLWDIFVDWFEDGASPEQRYLVENLDAFTMARVTSRVYTQKCRAMGLFDTDESTEMREESSDGDETEEEEDDIVFVCNDGSTKAQTVTERSAAAYSVLASVGYDPFEATLCAPTETFRSRLAEADALKNAAKREGEYKYATITEAQKTAESYVNKSTQAAKTGLAPEEGQGCAMVVDREMIANVRTLIEKAPTLKSVPFDLLAVRPTIEEARQVWTLDSDQSVIFYVIAHVLLEENCDATRDIPEGILMLGPPGTGKSRVLLALVWLAHQHGRLHEIAITAYTWKACQNIATVHLPATSTHQLFEIMPDDPKTLSGSALTRLQQRLAHVRILFCDEVSFIGQLHLKYMHERAGRGKYGREVEPLLAGILPVFAGDFNQHQPPGSTSLYRFAAKDEVGEPYRTDCMEARRLWRRVTDVFLLKTPHRYTANEGGVMLKRMSDIFVEPDMATPDEVEWLLQQINSRYMGPVEDMISKGEDVRVIVLRNAVRNQLNTKLALLRAANQGKQVLMWRNVDTVKDKEPGLTSEQWEEVTQLTPEATEGIPSVGIFFEGIEYLVADNKAPCLGRVRNNTAVGVRLILDRRERLPEDEESRSGVVVLDYPPVAVIVKPAATLREIDAFVNVDPRMKIPPGCVVVQPVNKSFEVRRGAKYDTVKISRTGLQLTLAYAVTDFYTQGMTLPRDVKWIVDFMPPNDHFGLKKESHYVTITRHRELEQLHALEPVVAEGTSIRDSGVFAKYLKTVQRENKDKDAEYRRLQKLADATREKYASLYLQFEGGSEALGAKRGASDMAPEPHAESNGTVEKRPCVSEGTPIPALAPAPAPSSPVGSTASVQGSLLSASGLAARTHGPMQGLAHFEDTRPPARSIPPTSTPAVGDRVGIYQWVLNSCWIDAPCAVLWAAMRTLGITADSYRAVFEQFEAHPLMHVIWTALHGPANRQVRDSARQIFRAAYGAEFEIGEYGEFTALLRAAQAHEAAGATCAAVNEMFMVAFSGVCKVCGERSRRSVNRGFMLQLFLPAHYTRFRNPAAEACAWITSEPCHSAVCQGVQQDQRRVLLTHPRVLMVSLPTIQGYEASLNEVDAEFQDQGVSYMFVGAAYYVPGHWMSIVRVEERQWWFCNGMSWMMYAGPTVHHATAFARRESPRARPALLFYIRM